MRRVGIKEGAELLAAAIIWQAIRDYIYALKNDDEGNRREVESFFRSEWFMLLLKTDGETMIELIEKEFRNPRIDRINLKQIF